MLEHAAAGLCPTTARPDALFVSMSAGVVTSRKTDGSTVKVPLEQLSEEDREWIEARRRDHRRRK